MGGPERCRNLTEEISDKKDRHLKILFTFGRLNGICEPVEVLKTIQEEKINDVFLVPAMWNFLLASYKKPRKVKFVEALPRNAAGKVLKRVLRETYRTG